MTKTQLIKILLATLFAMNAYSILPGVFSETYFNKMVACGQDSQGAPIENFNLADAACLTKKTTQSFCICIQNLYKLDVNHSLSDEDMKKAFEELQHAQNQIDAERYLDDLLQISQLYTIIDVWGGETERNKCYSEIQREFESFKGFVTKNQDDFNIFNDLLEDFDKNLQEAISNDKQTREGFRQSGTKLQRKSSAISAFYSINQKMSRNSWDYDDETIKNSPPLKERKKSFTRELFQGAKIKMGDAKEFFNPSDEFCKKISTNIFSSLKEKMPLNSNLEDKREAKKSPYQNYRNLRDDFEEYTINTLDSYIDPSNTYFANHLQKMDLDLLSEESTLNLQVYYCKSASSKLKDISKEELSKLQEKYQLKGILAQLDITLSVTQGELNSLESLLPSIQFESISDDEKQKKTENILQDIERLTNILNETDYRRKIVLEELYKFDETEANRVLSSDIEISDPDKIGNTALGIITTTKLTTQSHMDGSVTFGNDNVLDEEFYKPITAAIDSTASTDDKKTISIPNQTEVVTSLSVQRTNVQERKDHLDKQQNYASSQKINSDPVVQNTFTGQGFDSIPTQSVEMLEPKDLEIQKLQDEIRILSQYLNQGLSDVDPNTLYDIDNMLGIDNPFLDFDLEDDLDPLDLEQDVDNTKKKKKTKKKKRRKKKASTKATAPVVNEEKSQKVKAVVDKFKAQSSKSRQSTSAPQTFVQNPVIAPVQNTPIVPNGQRESSYSGSSNAASVQNVAPAINRSVSKSQGISYVQDGKINYEQISLTLKRDEKVIAKNNFDKFLDGLATDPEKALKDYNFEANEQIIVQTDKGLEIYLPKLDENGKPTGELDKIEDVTIAEIEKEQNNPEFKQQLNELKDFLEIIVIEAAPPTEDERAVYVELMKVLGDNK